MTDDLNETLDEGGIAARLAALQAPRYARLSDETWETVVAEYRAGETASRLAVKWGVSLSAVRAHIRKNDAMRANVGDGLAHKRAEMITRVEQSQTLNMVLKRSSLFADFNENDVVDPMVLTLLATVASGRAMMRQLWPEARMLAHLADVYSRLHERKAVEITLEDLLAIPDQPAKGKAASDDADGDLAEAACQSM